MNLRRMDPMIAERLFVATGLMLVVGGVVGLIWSVVFGVRRVLRV